MVADTPSFSVYASIHEIKELWKDLFARNKSFSFYQSYEWNECLEKKRKRVFGAEGKLAYWVYDKCVIFPLVIDDKQSIIRLLGYADASDYLSPVFAGEEEVLERGVRCLCERVCGKYRLVFSKVSEKMLFYKVLEKLNASGFLTCTKQQTVCMCIDTQTHTPTFYDSLSKSARNTYRTACNRIQKQGWPCEVKVSCGCLDASTAGRLSKLYKERRQDCDPRAGWYKKTIFWIKKALEKAGLYRIPDPLSRYSQLCPVFLAQTFINGELAAFCEGVLCNDGQTLCIARVATKKAYYHYSPGQILFVRAIDEIKNNVRYFDLTRGDEDYKVKLGAKPHANFLFEISGCNHTGKEENTL